MIDFKFQLCARREQSSCKAHWRELWNMKYSWIILQLPFPLCCHSTRRCWVFVRSGRTKCNVTESIIGQPVSHPEMTFEQIYLKMVNSVVSRRLSGAARPGRPPPLLSAHWSSLRHSSGLCSVSLPNAPAEKKDPPRRAERCEGPEGAGRETEPPKMSFVWRWKQFKEAGGGSAVDTGDGRGASQQPSSATQRAAAGLPVKFQNKSLPSERVS